MRIHGHSQAQKRAKTRVRHEPKLQLCTREQPRTAGEKRMMQRPQTKLDFRTDFTGMTNEKGFWLGHPFTSTHGPLGSPCRPTLRETGSGRTRPPPEGTTVAGSLTRLSLGCWRREEGGAKKEEEDEVALERQACESRTLGGAWEPKQSQGTPSDRTRPTSSTRPHPNWTTPVNILSVPVRARSNNPRIHLGGHPEQDGQLVRPRPHTTVLVGCIHPHPLTLPPLRLDP